MKASNYPGYGVEVRKDGPGFACIGWRTGWSGAGKTREAAMVAFADRKVMTDEEFWDSGCAMCG